VTTPARRTERITHSAIAQQLAAERQRDLLDHASRHRQARAARVTRPVKPERSRPSLLRKAYTSLASH
jgi:hypothetical protein